MKRHLTLGLSFVMLCCLLTSTLSFSVFAEDVLENDSIVEAVVTNFTAEESDTTAEIILSGNINNYSFEITATPYTLYDSIYPNKIFFVEDQRDLTAQVIILNLEFEIAASVDNLEIRNADLAGQNVLRVAAYINNQVYYAEQAYALASSFQSTAIPLSMFSGHEALETINSNRSWFMHVDPPGEPSPEETVTSTITSSISPASANSDDIIYHDSMRDTDIDVIETIGVSRFKQTQYIYGWVRYAGKITGGYMLRTNEWPAGTGRLLTSCLYYEIDTKTPSITEPNSSQYASLQFSYVAGRDFIYDPELNTLSLWRPSTDYRIYDVKLALECSQYTSGKGYDYIDERIYCINSTEAPASNGDIVLSIAKQFDKYNIISYTEKIFSLFSENDKDSPDGIAACSWPSDYNAHYLSMANQKRKNTFVRGVRLDGTGHKLTAEGNSCYLKAHIIDRDYEDSATNINLTKSINYAFSYRLKSPGFLGWWTPNDHGEITGETYKTYVR